MPAKDLFHNAVRCGLGKEGWRITNLSASFDSESRGKTAS
ncbi:element excision factor XisH family protein [Merismopedia glauca]